MEKRKTPRFKVHLPILFSGYNVTGEGIVVDFSLGGCSFHSGQKVKRGDFLKLRISIPNQDSPLVVDQTEVRFSGRQLFVLQFLAMQPQEQERLRRFLDTLEKRKSLRSLLQYPISFKGDQTLGVCTVRTLSMGGCTVGSDKYVSGIIEKCLEVSLHLPDHHDPLEVEQAVGRWLWQREFGLEFIRMRSEEQERLRQFLSIARSPKPG